MVQLGLEITPEDARFAPQRQRFLDIYREHLTQETRLFPGMDEVLRAIEERGMNWGVVTNKPAWLTNPLMEQMGLTQRAACIVSGDTTPERKPHPAPMLHACHQAGSHVWQCLYVGDAQRDIEAGKRAGMKTLAALFGYIGAADEPQLWDADAMIQHPLEILDWLPG
jgi:phosphoglycolate phosphatase